MIQLPMRDKAQHAMVLLPDPHSEHGITLHNSVEEAAFNPVADFHNCINSDRFEPVSHPESE